MIAYLKSDDMQVQADETTQPAHKPSLLAKALLNFAVKPAPYKDQYPSKPPISDKVAYGKYLVDAQMGCYMCHSASLQAWNLENPELTPNYMGGGTEFVSEEGTVISPSLLMDGWPIQCKQMDGRGVYRSRAIWSAGRSGWLSKANAPLSDVG